MFDPASQDVPDSDRFDSDDAVHRGLTGLQMLALVAMAVYIRDAFGEDGKKLEGVGMRRARA